ncbi:MAG TPA: hypothetical protein VGA50_04445 [Kiloniellales bacterium]
MGEDKSLSGLKRENPVEKLEPKEFVEKVREENVPAGEEDDSV